MELVVPSPKFQAQTVTALPALSVAGAVNCTCNGNDPVVGETDQA
jgi:hypothetical protein